MGAVSPNFCIIAVKPLSAPLIKCKIELNRLYHSLNPVHIEVILQPDEENLLTDYYSYLSFAYWHYRSADYVH